MDISIEKQEKIQHQFDAFSKKVIRYEMINCCREQERRGIALTYYYLGMSDRELSLSDEREIICPRPVTGVYRRGCGYAPGERDTPGNEAYQHDCRENRLCRCGCRTPQQRHE